MYIRDYWYSQFLFLLNLNVRYQMYSDVADSSCCRLKSKSYLKKFLISVCYQSINQSILISYYTGASKRLLKLQSRLYSLYISKKCIENWKREDWDEQSGCIVIYIWDFWKVFILESLLIQWSTMLEKHWKIRRGLNEGRLSSPYSPVATGLCRKE